MGVLNVTSIRVVLVILAFGLGLLGQAVVSHAASFEIPATTVGSATAGADCTGCGTGSAHGVMLAGCAVSCCSSIPALPTQGLAFEPPTMAIFVASVYAIGPGIAAAPDPHPPRPPLHS